MTFVEAEKYLLEYVRQNNFISKLSTEQKQELIDSATNLTELLVLAEITDYNDYSLSHHIPSAKILTFTKTSDDYLNLVNKFPIATMEELTNFTAIQNLVDLKTLKSLIDIDVEIVEKLLKFENVASKIKNLGNLKYLLPEEKDISNINSTIPHDKQEIESTKDNGSEAEDSEEEDDKEEIAIKRIDVLAPCNAARKLFTDLDSILDVLKHNSTFISAVFIHEQKVEKKTYSEVNEKYAEWEQKFSAYFRIHKAAPNESELPTAENPDEWLKQYRETRVIRHIKTPEDFIKILNINIYVAADILRISQNTYSITKTYSNLKIILTKSAKVFYHVLEYSEKNDEDGLIITLINSPEKIQEICQLLQTHLNYSIPLEKDFAKKCCFLLAQKSSIKQFFNEPQIFIDTAKICDLFTASLLEAEHQKIVDLFKTSLDLNKINSLNNQTTSLFKTHALKKFATILAKDKLLNSNSSITNINPIKTNAYSSFLKNELKFSNYFKAALTIRFLIILGILPIHFSPAQAYEIGDFVLSKSRNKEAKLNEYLYSSLIAGKQKTMDLRQSYAIQYEIQIKSEAPIASQSKIINQNANQIQKPIIITHKDIENNIKIFETLCSTPEKIMTFMITAFLDNPPSKIIRDSDEILKQLRQEMNANNLNSTEATEKCFEHILKLDKLNIQRETIISRIPKPPAENTIHHLVVTHILSTLLCENIIDDKKLDQYIAEFQQTDNNIRDFENKIKSILEAEHQNTDLNKWYSSTKPIEFRIPTLTLPGTYNSEMLGNQNTAKF